MTDFYYSFDENLNLVIEAKESSKFLGKDIVWRLQDKEGFDDLDMQVQFGPGDFLEPTCVWNGPPPSKKASSYPLYIYLVVADQESGGCDEKSVAIEIPPLPKKGNLKWQFQKDSNGKYRPVFY